MRRGRQPYCTAQTARFPTDLRNNRATLSTTQFNRPAASSADRPKAEDRRTDAINRVTVRRVLGSFARYKAQTALIVVTVIASAGLNVVPRLLLKELVDHGIMVKNLHVVTTYSLLCVAAYVAATLFSLVYSYFSIAVGQDIMREFRDSLYMHLQRMSLKFFTDTRTGEIQSRLANDVSGVQSVVSDTVAGLLSNFVIVLSSIAIMVRLDWRLTLLSVGILPVWAWVGLQVGGAARKIRTLTQEQLADLNSTMQETLSISGILLTKTSGRQALARTKFNKENQLLTKSQVKQAIVMRSFFYMIGLSFSVTPVLVYWLAGYLVSSVSDRSLTIGTIVAFTAAQAGLFFPLQGLLSAQVDISSSLALFERIFEYLDLEPDVVDSPNAIALTPEQVLGAVSFEHVSFKYAESSDRLTLDDVTFDARPGELVALVGHSGAGKTTLTYLIPRLYDAVTGRVTIDGIDVKEIKLESLGSIIAVVTQETYLVHDTIKENLRYGRPDATDKELADAAKVAAIHDHILSLPDGYETVVGERGYKLSGGEKQRISIARAVLKNPRILILDEATSALDTRSERLVQSALEPLMRGRTTFAIAHRLSTILAADNIVVMDGGRVVEQGTHESLLALGGHYSELYKLQYRDEEPTPVTA